jgi:uncharacterized coiled-coil DUF342 family protein
MRRAEGLLDMMRGYPGLAMNMEAELMRVGKQSRQQRSQALDDMAKQVEELHTQISKTRGQLNRLDKRCIEDANTIRDQYSKVNHLEEANFSMHEEKPSLQAKHDNLVKKVEELTIRV